MQPSQLVTQLLTAAGLAVALYVISRMLFLWAVQAVVSGQRTGGGKVLGFLRLPGNIVHETGHAVGYFLCGYRVRRLVPCIFDAQGRGSCQPGKPWLPVAIPWLATGLAALLPLVFGTLVLRYAAQMLNVHLETPQLAGSTIGHALIGSLMAMLRELHWHNWQTYLFLYLAFSVGAELAPSDVDLRRSLPAIAAATLCLGLVILAFGRLDASSQARIWLGVNLSHWLGWLSALLNFGILTTLIAGAVSFLPAAMIRVLRSR